MAKIIPITEHFQHFLAEMKESFWGDLYGQTQAGVAAVFRAAVGAAARPVFRGWDAYERRRGRRRDLSQRLLRAGFRDPLRHHSAAHRAHPGEELSAGGAEAISAAGRRSLAADPRSVFARHQSPGKWGGWWPP